MQGVGRRKNRAVPVVIAAKSVAATIRPRPSCTKWFYPFVRSCGRISGGPAESPREEENTMLKMKPACEKCQSPLEQTELAYICSFECTFCGPCTHTMSNVCPNCAGELVKRPVRMRKVADVAVEQVRRKVGKLFGR
jgi:uncharacterized protein